MTGTRLVARIVPDEPAASTTPGTGPEDAGRDTLTGLRRRARWLRRNSFAAVMLLLLGMFVVTGSTALTTRTTDVLAACPFSDKYYNYETQANWATWSAGASDADGDALYQPDLGNKAAYTATPPEWYGTILAWTSSYANSGGTGTHNINDETCGMVEGYMSSHLPSAILSLSSLGVWIIGNVYNWATDPYLMDQMLKPVDCIVAGSSSESPPGVNGSAGCPTTGGLRDTLFLNYLIPVIGLGALWALWNGLVKRRSSQALIGALWMTGAAVGAIIFLYQPTWIASTMNKLITQVNAVILTGVSAGADQAGGGSGAPADDICYLNKNKPAPPDLSPSAPTGGSDSDVIQYSNQIDWLASGRRANCAMWKNFVYAPWLYGQFGTDQPVVGIAEDNIKTELRRKFPHLNENAYNKLQMAQMDATLVDHDDKIRVANCAEIENQDSDEARCEVFPNAEGENKSLQEASLSKFESINNQIDSQGGLASMAVTWSGRNIAQRYTAALVALVAVTAGGIVILIFSFLSVIYQIGLMVLIIAAPLVLLFGIHPGFGRRLTLKWLETVLGLGVKRLVSLFLVTVLVGLMGVINLMDVGWIQKVMLIVILSFALVAYRRQLMQMLTAFNFTGQGDMSNMGGQATRRIGGAAASSGAGMASAAYHSQAMGLGAGAALGAIATAGARGATMGRGGGSPMMATRVGMASGRATAARAASRQAQQARAAGAGAGAGAAGAGGGGAGAGGGGQQQTQRGNNRPQQQCSNCGYSTFSAQAPQYCPNCQQRWGTNPGQNQCNCSCGCGNRSDVPNGQCLGCANGQHSGRGPQQNTPPRGGSGGSGPGSGGSGPGSGGSGPGSGGSGSGGGPRPGGGTGASGGTSGWDDDPRYTCGNCGGEMYADQYGLLRCGNCKGKASIHGVSPGTVMPQGYEGSASGRATGTCSQCGCQTVTARTGRTKCTNPACPSNTGPGGGGAGPLPTQPRQRATP